MEPESPEETEALRKLIESLHFENIDERVVAGPSSYLDNKKAILGV